MEEPTPRDRGRQESGEPVGPAMEDERLLDHHIEEVLDAFSDAASLAEGSPEAERRRRD
jgi:hypothetical protein